MVSVVKERQNVIKVKNSSKFSLFDDDCVEAGRI